MGTDTDITKLKNEALASASASPLHVGEPDDLADEDISQLLNGAKAVIGKAVWSANGAAAAQREVAHQQQQAEEKQEAKSREAIELAHLAEWNAQKTTLGGVEMTNEEAQKARQYVIDNEDYYANRAVREGRIREDEKEEFKQNNQRIRELEEKTGRGTATERDRKECDERRRSHLGIAGEFYAAEAAQHLYGKKMDAETKAENANAGLRTGVSAAAMDNAFQSAPDIKEHFANAVTADSVTRKQLEAPSPIAIRSVQQVSFAPE